MNAWFWVFVTYITLNSLVMVSMIFVERRKLTSVISWLTVVSLLPGLGFVIYLIFGSGLSIRVRRLISKFELYENEYDEELKNYFSSEENSKTLRAEDREIMNLCYNFGSVLCPANDVKIFTNGEDKIKSLLQDIENAQSSIKIKYGNIVRAYRN